MKFYISLPDPKLAVGANNAFSFSAHGVEEFAAQLQYTLHFEGRDLTDKEAYRHLLEKWGIDADDFYEKLASETYLEQARYEFQLCKQLQVTGFPCVLLHMGDNKFHLLARGFTPYEDLKARLDMVLNAGNR